MPTKAGRTNAYESENLPGVCTEFRLNRARGLLEQHRKERFRCQPAAAVPVIAKIKNFWTSAI
jgi:hypothetical protein